MIPQAGDSLSLKMRGGKVMEKVVHWNDLQTERERQR
jgi:hypothetical protein